MSNFNEGNLMSKQERRRRATVEKLAQRLELLAAQVADPDANSESLAAERDLTSSGVRGVLTGRRGLSAHVIFGLHWRELVAMKRDAGDGAHDRIVQWLHDSLDVTAMGVMGVMW